MLVLVQASLSHDIGSNHTSVVMPFDFATAAENIEVCLVSKLPELRIVSFRSIFNWQ